MFRIFLVVCYVAAANAINYLGCYKFQGEPTGCRVTSKEAQAKLSDRLTKSQAQLIQWLREQQKSDLWFDVSASSWVMTNMILAGYVNDDGVCSKTIDNSVLKIRKSVKDVADMSAGKLAMMMIGMRATCQKVTVFHGQNLVEILSDNMASFPQDDFNNYYQYSLGVLALYLNGVDIPESYVGKLVGYLTGSESQCREENTAHVNDTEALAIIALTAAIKRTGISDQSLAKANKIIEEAVARIDKQLEKGDTTNLVTVTHLLQVLQLQKNRFSEKSYCENIMTSLLGKQEPSGSFGGLMTSAGVPPLLSGVSVLELRNMKCPRVKDVVEKSEIEKFIKSRQKHRPGSKVIVDSEVKVTVAVEAAVDGIDVKAPAQTLTLARTTTALSALGLAAKRHKCFKYHLTQTSWGPFVDAICGIRNNNREKTYWMFYVNEKLASVGAGKYVLKNNDDVVFRYKKV